jgi:hypothetical protein
LTSPLTPSVEGDSLRHEQAYLEKEGEGEREGGREREREE